MSKFMTLAVTLLFSLSALASDISLKGFKERFTLVKNPEGKVVAIKLNKAMKKFSIKPFLQQIKEDLQGQQMVMNSLSESERNAEINEFLTDIGLDNGNKSNSDEAEAVKQALLYIPNVDIETAFVELDKGDFWEIFQSKLNEAMMFIDPTVLANLEDSRFFYKKNVTYKVVQWALKEAQKRFSNVPVLNIASFVIVRVHDMMLEQRHFHHNMLLHYFEIVSEDKLGMTKEEVDRTVSSIYEYKIDATNVFESNRANADWQNYGMNNFYRMVRSGNTRMRDWQGPLSNVRFENVKKIDYAFAEVTEQGARKIYHLHVANHMFTSKPALAFDYANPQRVKRNRALLNLAGVAMGFIKIPGWLRSSADNFMKSFYVQQVRMEGALVGNFESTGESAMVNRIYSQRANFYIVR